MRYIFIVLFLASFGSFGMGGVGDVYLCKSVRNIYVSHLTLKDNGKLKFKFIVDTYVYRDGGNWKELLRKDHLPPASSVLPPHRRE